MKRRKKKLYFLFLSLTAVSASMYCIFIYFGLFMGRLVNSYGNKIYLSFGEQEFPYPEEAAVTWHTHEIYGKLKKYKTLASLPVPESVKSNLLDEFDDLREKYRNLLVTDDFDKTNAAVVKYVNSISKEAEYCYTTLDKRRGRRILWPEMKGVTWSDDLSIQFRMLFTLTLAYGTNGTIYYKNEDILLTIEDCLKFMVSSERYDGDVYYGNWWHWQVGAPTYLLDILIIIKDKLKSEQLKRYTNIISEYVCDPYSKLPSMSENETFYVVTIVRNPVSSSQTVELARVVLGLGILQKNETKISQSLVSLVKVMQLVTILDGFYKDGSYIEHDDIPCTGSYGNDLVKKLGDILVITQGSKLALSSSQVEPFVEIVERAFIPLVYRGEMIAPVKGRAISRQPSITQIGSDAMYSLLNIATFGSDENKKKLRESVKHWMRQNPDYYFSNARMYHDLQMTMNLLNDSTLLGDKMPFIGAKMYASMDRFVQQTINYTLGISLYSNRISAFEAGNNENKHGWHTADGAIYLYNYDDVQFRNAYWPTVDPYRIPGTTVDTIELNDELSSWQRFNSDEKWVGGVASGNRAIVGMVLNKNRFKNYDKLLSTMDLKGKKSWFIVEGQIVALGAEITGSTMASIETIVDNRLLNDAYNYEVWSDSGQINETTKELTVNWLLLKSNNQRSSIGYYFPKRETVHIIFEIRFGTYKDININSNENTYNGTYRKFIIDHGQIPFNAKYAYVLLPGITLAEIIKYANSKTVNILENSAQIQAVQIINDGYLGINFWNTTGGTVMGISSNQSVSLIRLTDGNQQSYIVSDPTQSDYVIKIKVPRFTRVATMSEGIKYVEENDTFLVDFTKSGGASKQFAVIL